MQHHLAAMPGVTEVDVIRKALDSLDWHDQERQAVQEGIDAWHAGDVQEFDQFAKEFRTGATVWLVQR